MKKAEVKRGGKYAAKVSGRICTVQIIGERAWGTGWNARNLDTNRDIIIKSAAKLRYEVEA